MWRIIRHILFWSTILFWSSTVYDYKGVHVMYFIKFNLVRLPLLMAATYTVLYYLLPKFVLKDRQYLHFGIAFSILFIGTTILDRWLIGSDLIGEILKDTGLSYTFFNELPLFRNAFLLLSIIGLALTARLFNFQERMHKESSLNTTLLEGDKPVITDPFLLKNDIFKTTSSTDFLIKSGPITHKLNWDSVLFLEKNENYVIYHTNEKRILQRTTLNSLTSKLPVHFCRIHRSFIVSLAQIEQIERDFLIIKAQRIPIGRTYRANFLGQLANFNNI